MNSLDQFSYWRVVRRGLLEALDMVADSHLAFAPATEMWSLGTVARHIANAEEGWFRYAVTRELDEWPEAYCAENYATAEVIQRLLGEVHDRTEALLEATSDADLDRLVDLPWDEGLTLRQIIWHVMGHEIHHRGEIYLMLGMMGLEAPDV